MNFSPEILSDIISSYPERLQRTKIVDVSRLKEIEKRLEQYDFSAALQLDNLALEVNELLWTYGFHVPHQGYFGLFNPAAGDASIIADALVSLHNPQLAVRSHAPIASAIETHVLNFFIEKIGFDPITAFGNFTTGGSEANLTAMLVAMADAFPDYLENGITAIQSKPVIYLSAAAHNSFDKIVKNIGLGANALRKVPVDSSLKIDVEQLKQFIQTDLKNGFTPLVLIGTAGTTGSGTIDPLIKLSEIARHHDMWFHVDAAWAGPAVISEKLRVHLSGIELADSVTMDAHKWLSVSMGAGMFFTKWPDPVHQAFNIPAAYMPSHLQTDPYLTSVQWSRRFIGLKVFLTLAQFSAAGLATQLERQCELSDMLRAKLVESGWLIVNDSPVAVLNFTHPQIISKSIDALDIQKQIESDGEFWISTLPLEKFGRVLRTCITSTNTEEDDVSALVNKLNRFVS